MRISVRALVNGSDDRKNSRSIRPSAGSRVQRCSAEFPGEMISTKKIEENIFGYRERRQKLESINAETAARRVLEILPILM